MIDAASSEPRDDHPIMEVVGGSPTPEERAAVEAVLTGMADEWAETKHRTVLDTESEWQARSRTPSGHRWKRA